MMIVAVNEIAKKPKILTDIEEIIYIKDKRKNILKSIVVPAKYLQMMQENIQKIEYQIWKERNKKSLMEDFDSSEVIAEIGDKLD